MDEELREKRRQKYEKHKEQAKEQEKQTGSGGYGGSADSAPPVAPAPSAVAASSSSTATASPDDSTNGAETTQPQPVTLDDNGNAKLQRVHILPLKLNVDEDKALKGKRRIDFLAPDLRRMRDAKDRMFSGQVLTVDGVDFIVMKAEPDEGCLCMETDFFVDGDAVNRFEKVQFLGIQGPRDSGNDKLFEDYIKPYFDGYTARNGRKRRVLRLNEVVTIKDAKLVVEACEPGLCGVVDGDSLIFANWDQTPDFEKIHFVPFQDTLPRVYEFNIFGDYLKPYLEANMSKRFSANELFTYHGVQFKVVCCEPDGPGRVGKDTMIFCEGVLHPSLRNLLPPELLQQVAQLPPGLQMLLLNTERSTRELEDMLNNRRGMFEDTIQTLDEFKWGTNAGLQGNQEQCMVCLCDFDSGEDCRRLPCGHVYHKPCIDQWLRRCPDCPICKNNTDRTVRNY